MTMIVRDQHIAAIRKHGEADYPHEACGLMGGTTEGDRTVVRQLVPLANERSDSARNRYLIDPDAFRRAQKTLDDEGLDIVGVYHSHPDHPAEPSETDRRAGWEGWSYLIAAVESGEVTALRSWRLVGAGFVEEEVT